MMDTVNLVSDYFSLFALFARHFVAKLMLIPSNCTNFSICIFSIILILALFYLTAAVYFLHLFSV